MVQRACCRRSVRGNKLTRLAAPPTNGTCCATTINVGPTEGSGQPIELRADGSSYTYYNYKNIPIDNITVCATDAANPGKRQTNDGPDEEKGYRFKLSVRPTCDGKSNMSLRVEQEQARPHTHARTHPALACARFRPRGGTHVILH